MAVRSILIVCQGNICRSPMAEGFFSYQLKNHRSPIRVSSAGISALVNYPAEPTAQIVMKKNGIDISSHRARLLTIDLIRQTDLIFVMTDSQRVILERQFLTAKGKTYLLGHWRNFEIKDPLNQPIDAFEKVYQQIDMAWHDWKTRIVTCQICV